MRRRMRQNVHLRCHSVNTKFTINPDFTVFFVQLKNTNLNSSGKVHKIEEIRLFVVLVSKLSEKFADFFPDYGKVFEVCAVSELT